MSHVHADLIEQYLKNTLLGVDEYSAGVWGNTLWSRVLNDVDGARVFRIEETHDSIDWSHVHEKFNYMARDENGVAFLYSHEPRVSGGDIMWVSNVSGGEHTEVNGFASYTRGNADWTNSLVSRNGESK